MKLEGVNEIFGALERGQVAVDFTNTLRDTLNKLMAQGKAKGNVTLKMNLSVDGEFVACTPEVDSKVPKPKRKTSNFWIDDDGNLCTSDPRQTAMFDPPPRRKPIGQTIDN